MKNKEMAVCFMDEALKEAQKAFDEGEVPVGAVVVKDGIIIGRGHNRREKEHKISSHAEINAMNDAMASLGRWNLADCSLYVTLEPCLMCAGAILQARIHYLAIGAMDEKAGAVFSKYHVFDGENACTAPFIDKNVKNNECSEILKRFFFKTRQEN